MLCVVYFSDESKNKTERIEISDKKTGETIQTIIPPENEIFTNSPAYFKNITFDGNMSIIIPVRREVDEHIIQTLYFDAYIWDKETGKFIEAPSFKEIANPAINTSEKMILSHKVSEDNRWYYMYFFNNNQFTAEKSLCWEVTDPINNESFAHLIEKDEEKTVSEFDIYISTPELSYSNSSMKPYFEKGSVWELYGDKWKCSFKNYCKDVDEENLPSDSDNDKSDEEPAGSVRPSDEEVLNLFNKATELIFLYTENPDYEVVKNEFPNAEIYTEKYNDDLGDEIICYKSKLNYDEAKTKYSEIFTRTALNSFINYNFSYEDGNLSIGGWEGSGHKTKLQNIKISYVNYKNGNYNYIVYYTENIDGDKIFEKDCNLSIVKTQNGYKVSSIDPLMSQSLMFDKRT